MFMETIFRVEKVIINVSQESFSRFEPIPLGNIKEYKFICSIY